MSFIIFDTEYTTWPGCQENGWRGNQKKEIVQIAALKISDKFDVLAEFNALCQPIINPVLSEYFTDLTHITNKQVKKNGEAFPTVYQRFKSFIENDICYSHAWGSNYENEADGNIIRENISLNNLSESQQIIYRNIAPVFKMLYRENNIRISLQTSGQIADLLGIKEKLEALHLDVHNALYDVYSILEGLKFFYPRSQQIMNQFGSSYK